jgi:predicted Zn-dependent protease
MKKLLLEFILIVVLFFATWFVLSRFDWVSIFDVRKKTDTTEEKLGDLFWEFFSKTENEVKVPELSLPLDSMLTRICESNSIDRSKIKLHIIRKDDVNAFTLPNNHLVVFTGLITDCENPEELCGVLGHELAHMEKNHVMKKMVKEVGLSVLITLSSGRGSPEVIRQVAKLLSSTAYDRALESEADRTSVDYMVRAQIDPEPFANFMYRMSEKEKNMPDQVYWIATHPESKERAEQIIAYLKGVKHESRPVADEAEWEQIRQAAGNL